MHINLDYCSRPMADGRTEVAPFAYCDDNYESSIRDWNHGMEMVAKIAKLSPEDCVPPGEEWNPVFRIVLSVMGTRNGVSTYGIGYSRMDFSPLYNGVVAGCMELFHALKKILRRAKRPGKEVSGMAKCGKKKKGGCKGC